MLSPVILTILTAAGVVYTNLNLGNVATERDAMNLVKKKIGNSETKIDDCKYLPLEGKGAGEYHVTCMSDYSNIKNRGGRRRKSNKKRKSNKRRTTNKRRTYNKRK